MPTTIRKVSYAYVTVVNKSGEAARILEALRDAGANLLAFSGFPQGRNRAQVDIVTDDIDRVMAAAKRHKWKLSRTKRAFLAQGTDEVGAALPPLARLAAAKINVIAADAVAAGERRFAMLFWVAPRDYNRAAKLLEAA
ncbi:MAG: hypothetical protein AUH10_04955 [Gammaproteobacteria bacterium 13_2_20CM_66_19]|nr:MAG: hypothetical protein AUH10_04955 [Gammaproteobacteria bacterium 13_2_20CM_66_19]TLY93735.1 MAG: hypothetical protein E6K38_10295 [Gammaproteobacteria bacterium]